MDTYLIQNNTERQQNQILDSENGTALPVPQNLTHTQMELHNTQQLVSENGIEPIVSSAHSFYQHSELNFNSSMNAGFAFNVPIQCKSNLMDKGSSNKAETHHEPPGSNKSHRPSTSKAVTKELFGTHVSDQRSSHRANAPKPDHQVAAVKNSSEINLMVAPEKHKPKVSKPITVEDPQINLIDFQSSGEEDNSYQPISKTTWMYSNDLFGNKSDAYEPCHHPQVVNKSDQHIRSTTKKEFLEPHQDPPRRSIDINLYQNNTRTVPITLTIKVQLCRTRVPARRFVHRRATPKCRQYRIRVNRSQTLYCLKLIYNRKFLRRAPAPNLLE